MALILFLNFWLNIYESRRISGCCFSSGQRKRRKYICVCSSLHEYWWLMIVCYHRLTAKRNKKKKRKARIVFVRGATLIANTLRKHKPLFLCTYIYVSLTFIVFCKTTSRNLHTWHFKSQERRTRHSARIEPKKKHVNSVFNHARYSKVIQQWIPLSGFRVYWIQDSLSGKLGFRRLCDPS